MIVFNCVVRVLCVWKEVVWLTMKIDDGPVVHHQKSLMVEALIVNRPSSIPPKISQSLIFIFVRRA